MELSGSSSGNVNKFIIPDDYSSSTHGGVGKMKLSVDPDFADVEEEQNVCEGSSYRKPIILPDSNNDNDDLEPVPREVKMSIGNCDDDRWEEDENETSEEKSRRIAAQLKRFREKDNEESFDFTELNLRCDDNLKDFFRSKVGAIFPNDNNVDFGEIIMVKKRPKIIEGYLWGAVIGVGSYGKVKEVIDTYTLTRRAVKIMKHDKIRKIPNGITNIRNEIRILNKINHSNIIKLIEVFEIKENRRIYMIFEYCIGSVQQLLELEPAKRITVGEAHLIFVETIKGLDYLHSRRISHKDIKPGNLLISIEFTIKICDFGVAEEFSLFQDAGNCTKVNGTPKFQPPECVAGNHEYFDGFKADMWGMGVTLYNMISGKYPFDKPLLIQLYDSISKDPLVMPNNIELSPHLEDIISRLLEKDFKTRIGTYAVMAHPWFITSFPEDQGLGRIMERMRTGNRPMTMRPSMQVLFDGEPMNHDVPAFVEGGEIDHETFKGFKYLDVEDNDSISEGRRPSSRSNPTSAPRLVSSDTETCSARPRRPRRSFFSCIFKNRSDSP